MLKLKCQYISKCIELSFAYLGNYNKLGNYHVLMETCADIDGNRTE